MLKAKNDELDEEEWKMLKKLTLSSLNELNSFREQEGAKLEADFRKRIQLITDHLNHIVPLEGERIEQYRDRIDKNLKSFVETEKVNQDRFEQEMIYYLEKIDITEEKTRLIAHCEYFLETLKINLLKERN